VSGRTQSGRVKVRRRGIRGHSVIEAALALPWIIFLFVGVLYAGFYAYSLIATQSAARVAALYTSASTSTAADTAGACSYALEELRRTANIGAAVSDCTALPLIVNATSTVGPDGAAASRVSVTYQTPGMIPIPGLLTRQLTVTRIVQMRVRS